MGCGGSEVVGLSKYESSRDDNSLAEHTGAMRGHWVLLCVAAEVVGRYEARTKDDGGSDNNGRVELDLTFDNN